MPPPRIHSSRARQTSWTPAISGWCPRRRAGASLVPGVCLDVLDPADPQGSRTCCLRRLIYSAAVELARLYLRQRCCASVLQRRAARHFSSRTASRAWARMGSIFTLGSALWTRCLLLLLRSAPLCWRSSACGLLHSFFLDRRKRISGRTWICSAVSPTHGAPNSLCIAFAPTSWSRTV